MDSRKILTQYMEKIINSKDKKEWVSCIAFLEGKIQESEKEKDLENKKVFSEIKERILNYYNKNINI